MSKGAAKGGEKREARLCEWARAERVSTLAAYLLTIKNQRNQKSQNPAQLVPSALRPLALFSYQFILNIQNTAQLYTCPSCRYTVVKKTKI